MKCICIAGASQSDLALVSDILEQAGMKLPNPAKREDLIDIGSWHEQALTMDTEGADVGYTIASPGRFMEQLAGDIFSANLKSTLWGWADTRSTWLLDFWLDFDPRLYFVLVYVSPEQMLASAINAQAEIKSVSGVMEAWQAHYQQLLRFHLRNPQRSLLVDVCECVKNPHVLIEHCASRWKLPHIAPPKVLRSQVAIDPLSLYLAQQLCKDYSQAQGLQHELAATLFRLGKAEQASDVNVILPEQIIANYSALRDRSIELELLQATRDELAILKKNFDNTVASQARQLKDTEQENELLLLQLHQAQEELETLFLKHESVQKQRNALQGEIDTLATTCEKQRLLATESQIKIDQLNKKHNDTIVDQAQQLKDAEKENELLLLQLHQVQEELEHYFLQHQDQQKDLQYAETRWQRMLQRNPDYCDYESIKALPDKNDKGNTIIWRLKNLNAAGRSLPEIEFKTIMEQGIAGFVFPRQFNNIGLLTRWPANLIDQNELTIIPVGKDDILQQRVETLLNLATSDWDLLGVLLRLLGTVLQQPIALTTSNEFDSALLYTGLTKLRGIIDKFPATLRYDHVTLKREQVNPDYEHLWLRLDNLAFGNKRWTEFEFRLSCANVRPNHFGAYPKIEFPEETGHAPFEAWFIESYDDFGAKLEFRFALPDAMDMGVLQRISDNDRGFLTALIARLPAILGAMQCADVQLRRPWQDWINMVKDIQRIYVLQVTSQYSY